MFPCFEGQVTAKQVLSQRFKAIAERLTGLKARLLPKETDGATNSLPQLKQGALALLLAPEDLRFVSKLEQTFWKRLGFPGFEDQDYCCIEARGETDIGLRFRGLGAVRSKIRSFMALEYCGAVACVAIGYAGDPTMWVYRVVRPLYLVGCMRAELILASYACAAPLFQKGGGNDTLVRMRSESAKVFGIKIGLSRLAFATISNLPAIAAPWQAAVVLGDIWKLYYSNESMQGLWSEGWKGIPGLETLMLYVDLPIIFTTLTLVAWGNSLRTTVRSLKRSETGISEASEIYDKRDYDAKEVHYAADEDLRLNRLRTIDDFHQPEDFGNWGEPDLRTAGDAINLFLWSEILHEVHSFKDIDTKRNDVGEKMMPAIREALRFEMIFRAISDAEYWTQCAAVVNSNRTARFSTKTVPHAVFLLLKSSWVMLLLEAAARTGDRNDKHIDTALNEVYLALMLSMYTCGMQCLDQLKHVLALRALVIRIQDPALWEELGLLGWQKGGLNRNLLGAAKRTLLKQTSMLAVVALLLVLTVVRVAGAQVCSAHTFGVFTGCGHG